MKMRTRFDCYRASRRGAFTLIELLVVVTIIAALAALSASAVLKFIEVQQNNNTQSTLDRTQGQLGKAWSRVKDQAYKETIPTNVQQWIVTNLASNASNPNDPNVVGRARVIYVKLKLQQAFPMSFAEVFNSGVPANYPVQLSTLPGYSSYLGSLGITSANFSAVPYEYQSSACLLMALQRGVSGAGINPDELTKGGATGSYAAPSGNLPYLTDAWSRPLFFSRVPVGVPLLNSNPYPGGGQAGANDPLDPQGYLQTPGWAANPGTGQTTPQAQLFVSLTQQQLAGANSSYKQAGMLASGGGVNWEKTGQLTFQPVTFQPGYYTLANGAFAGSAGSGVMYSTP